MIEIERYLYDGANWQAKGVLAYIQDAISNALYKSYDKKTNTNTAKAFVDRYTNCREQGYIVSVIMHNGFGQQKHWVFYEHRNTDSVCVYSFEGMLQPFTCNTPTFDRIVAMANFNSSSDYEKSFELGKILECGEYIIDEIKKFVEKEVEFDK